MVNDDGYYMVNDGYIIIIWLVVDLPLWKIGKSVGMMKFPMYGKKNVPNHQPDTLSVRFEACFVCITIQLNIIKTIQNI